MRASKLIVVVAGVVLAAPPTAAAADARIDFTCCSYSPKEVRIKPGESVTWAPGAGNTFNAADGVNGHPLAPAGNAEPFGKTSGAAPHPYRFASAGRYRFYCTSHGTPSGADGMTGTVIVSNNRPPVAAFAVDATDAATGAFSFDAGGFGGSSDPDLGQTLTYAWDFGDGTSRAASSSPTVAHAFPPAGTVARTYQVVLSVLDSSAEDPAGDSVTRAVTVPARSPSPAPADAPASAGASPAGVATAPSSGTPGPPAPSRPGVTLTLARRSPALATLVRRGLTVGVRSQTAARARGVLRVGGRTVATSPVTPVLAGTRRTLRLRFVAAARPALLRGRGRVTGRLSVTVTAASGAQATSTRTVRLR